MTTFIQSFTSLIRVQMINEISLCLVKGKNPITSDALTTPKILFQK